ncbi:MAG: hypothetical protein V1875_03555 [Candidatus Altiarchaeota archaeon]
MRAQLFTGDMVFGIFIFMITLGILMQLWQSTYDHLWSAEGEYEMNWLAETAANQLVRTAGDPYDWTPSNVVAIGLARARGGGRVVESRILDPDKLLSLIDMFNENYSLGRDHLLGSGKYEIYFELSCLNSSGLHCLQGMPLNSVTGSVECRNLNSSIHVNTYSKNNRFTDVYMWIEAEDLWGHLDPSHCQKLCSAGNMSSIGLLSGDTERNIRTPAGDYMLWVRGVDSNSGAKLLVNGVPHNLFNSSAKDFVGWNWLGNQTLAPTTDLAIADQELGDTIDAILLTTDRFYDPRLTNVQSLGDPNLYGKCVFGNTKEGANIIARTKTAIVGLPVTSSVFFSGMQPVVDDTVQLRVVLWSGEAMQPRNKSSPTTTSTTLRSASSITCDGNPAQSCISPNWPVVKLQSVTFWQGGSQSNRLVCGATEPLTVAWSGRHAGDPNFFGFFIENGSYKVGACQSNNTVVEIGENSYEYDMNCSLTTPASFNLPDGEYDFIVTGEDFSGYCPPRNINTDDERKFKVNLEGCVVYDPLQCNPPSGIKFGCLSITDTVDRIYRVDVTGDTLVCDVPIPVNVSFGGIHGNDLQIQWAYMLKNPSGGYTCVGLCRSNVASAETQKEYYDLRCNIKLNGTDCSGIPYTFPDGSYELEVIAESDANQYCNNPDGADAEAVFRRQVSVDCSGAGLSSSSASSATSTASSSPSSSSSESSGGIPVTVGYFMPTMPLGDPQKTGADFYSTALGPWDVTVPNVPYADGVQAVSFTVPSAGTYYWNLNITFDDSSSEWLFSPDQTLIVP